jgi:hypothetical protein
MGDHNPDMDLNVLHTASDAGQIGFLNAFPRAL